MSIKGFKSQQALKQKLSGYTEDQSIDQQRYVTVQEMPGRRHAIDAMIHAIYEITTVPLIAAAGSNIRVIKCVGHGASKNDVIKLSNGTQFSAISVPDADTIITSVELDVSPVGDTFTVWRHITPAYNSDGSLNVSVLPSPLSITVDGITTVVNVDTVVPADTVRVPVELYGASGQINITAGDINVQLSDTGVNPDITRIGNGTNRLDINASNEALVHDTDSLAQLVAANVNLDAMELNQTNGTQKSQIVDAAGDIVDVKLLSDALVSTDKALVSQAVIHGVTTAGGGAYVDVKVTPSGALTVEAEIVSSALPTGAATSANQTTEITRLGDIVEAAPATDTDSSGLNGRLQRIAQRLTSLIALLPSSIGQKVMADSLSVSIASNQGPIGSVQVSSSALPTGAATAAGLTLIEAQVTDNNTNQGTTADAVATTDTGTFSLISLTKKIAQNISQMSAKLPAALGITTSAGSLSIAPASDAVFSTKPKVTTGSYAENLTLTTVATFTAPANAVGAIVQADDANAASFRVKQGAVATSTSGMQLQAGRDMELKSGSDISVCSESVSVKVYVQWFIQA